MILVNCYVYVYLIYFLLFLLLYWMGVHCGIYKSSYHISNISYLHSPPPSFSFILPFPHSNRYHFFSFHTYVHSTCTINHPPMSFPHLLPPLTNTIPTRQDLFCLPVISFCKWKKLKFFLFKIVKQGVSSWHFHVHRYCSLNWSSLFFLFLP
jgi:hypothetical protein